jgi:hypothetical protein
MDDHLSPSCTWKDPYEFDLMDRATHIMNAVGYEWDLDSKRLLDLAKKIDFAATFPGSIIDGLIPFADDREEFEKLRKKLIFPQSHFPEIAGEIEEDLESKRCRVRTRNGIIKAAGPPEYMFVRLLCPIYEEFTGRKPGARDTGGPFERFVKEATRQFGQVARQFAVPPSTTQIRRALAATAQARKADGCT